MEVKVVTIADLVRIATLDGHWNTNVPGKARVFGELCFGQFGVPLQVGVTSFINCSGVSFQHQLAEILRHRDEGTVSLAERTKDEIGQNSTNRLADTISLTTEVEDLFLDFQARFNKAVQDDKICQKIYNIILPGTVLGHDPNMEQMAIVEPTDALLELQNNPPKLLVLRPSHLAHDAVWNMEAQFQIPFGRYILNEIARHLPGTSIIFL